MGEVACMEPRWQNAMGGGHGDGSYGAHEHGHGHGHASLWLGTHRHGERMSMVVWLHGCTGLG